MASLTGWTYRKKITISPTHVSASLSSFPLFVKLSGSNDFSTSLANGFDIRFTDSTGQNLLNYERTSWSGGSGTSATASFWVNVPIISPSESSSIYIYFGNNSAGDGQNKTAVWDSNYQAVWHLGELIGNLLDSTTNHNDCIPTGVTQGVQGLVGLGVEFHDNGTDNLKPIIPLSFSGDFSFSVWRYITRPPIGNEEVLIGRLGQDANFAGAHLRLYNNPSDLIVANTAATTFVWANWGISRSGSALSIYVNGFRDPAVGSWSGIFNPTYLGKGNVVSTVGSGGTFNEFRISNIQRSSAWVNFEYYNQISSNNELIFGSAELNTEQIISIGPSVPVPKKGKISNVQSIILIDSSSFQYDFTPFATASAAANLPTDDDYSKGYMYRYFFRLSSNRPDRVKETDEVTFNSIQNYFLYSSIKIKWKLIGDAVAASSINSNIINNAEKDLPGIRQTLNRNVLLYWKDLPDVVGQFDVTKKISPQLAFAKPPISNVATDTKQITTETDDVLLTQDYEEIIIEDRTRL